MKNQTGKYFKYAIGEIVLVVIGILIALSINNWNTTRSNSKIEQQYIVRLINELEQEIDRFKTLKEGFKEQNEAVIRLLADWKEENLVVQDTAQFWRDFFAASGAGPWHKDPVIWTQLVQSGELKLIKNQQLIETLFEHYANVKSISNNFNEYPTQTTNDVRKLIATTFAKTDFLLNPTRRGSPPPEALQIVIDDIEVYRVPFVRVGIIARIHIGQMELLLKSAENAKKQLVKNLSDS